LVEISAAKIRLFLETNEEKKRYFHEKNKYGGIHQPPPDPSFSSTLVEVVALQSKEGRTLT